MKKFLPLSLLLLLILGCAAVTTTLDITYFEPIPDSPGMKTFVQDKITYVNYENHDYRITAALFEYNDICIVTLSITNETSSDVKSSDYSVGLYDGRDQKPLKIVSREDITAVRAKYAGSSSGLEITGDTVKAVESAVTAIIGVVKPSTNDMVVKGLDQAIDNYFSFRPIYAKECRDGILSFLVDFKLEYPLTLKIKLRKEEIDLKFRLKQEIK
jgi:hypothetical protein